MTTLREERASIWEQMKALSELASTEGRDLTSEEYQKYEKLEGDLDGKRSHIERLEKELELDGKLTRRDVTPAPEQTEGVKGYTVPASRAAELVRKIHGSGDESAAEELRSIANKVGVNTLAKRVRQGGVFNHDAHTLYTATDEYRDAYVAFLRSASDRAVPLNDEQRAALNVGTGANGGYTVPVEFYRQLVISERFFGVMRQLSRTIVTADNGIVSIPKVDDSSRAASVWLAEAAAFTESEDAFLQTQLGAFKQGHYSKVSDELLLDSAFDILGFVAQSAGQALGILANTAYVTGANASTTTPEGLLTKATVGFTMPTGNSTSITSADYLFELYHSIRPAYRRRAQWLLSDTLIKQIRQLKTSQGVYIWEPSLTAGDPDTLIGQPVYADPDVAVPAANALCGGFGSISDAYWIRDVQDVTVKILNELFALNGQVGYRIHRRTDGDIVDTLAFKSLKNSAT